MPDENTARATVTGAEDDEVLELIAAEVAQLAAERLRKKLGSARQIGTKTTPTDTVTSADVETEDLIREALRSATPDASIVGEEGTAIDGTTDIGWVIDPSQLPL